MIIALALAVLFAPATTVDVPLADVELRLQGAVAPADALLPFVLGGIAGGTIATTAWRYVTGVSFVEALSGDLYSDCEDVELKGDDEIQGMLYGSSYLLADNDSVTLAMANNRLGDSRNPAMAKVKLKIAEGINQGKTKAEIQNDVQAVVDSHYATIEHNLYTQLST
ncbi:MAG: hypothetical protein GWN18_13150, partial [Thermoplasmata archaeon]|nr:hypothetical protein [Thermoplasmata archaeon]NIV79661.1 hypothetical protein [Thermoplasmata archaeon]NIW83476.1 hypothetical protein [Thermoplasmata archaeon]NIW88648.1 hypothetical protein [Thermoplasmata archaeon]NIY03399.1 hypothetical protein [Thermoplasmata archaeon]